MADVLAEILAELREIRRLLAHQTAESPVVANVLTRADHARLGRLLPAIAGVQGSEPFLVRDLFEPDAPAALKLVTAGTTTKQIGQLFGRAEGVNISSLAVQRTGLETNVVLWRVVRFAEVSKSHGSPTGRSGRAVMGPGEF